MAIKKKSKKRKATQQRIRRRVHGTTVVAAPHRKTTRRRKVGEIQTDFKTPLLITAGLIGAKFIGNQLPTTISGETKAIIMAGIGFGGYMFIKNKDAKDVLAGVAASGVLSLGQKYLPSSLQGVTSNGQNPYVIGASHRHRAARVHGIAAPQPIRKMGYSQTQLTPFVVGAMG
jgi:hypothetical protein